MRKKLAAAGLGITLLTTLTGCGNNETLTTEQNDRVADYIAGVMLEHSYDNSWKYRKAKNEMAETKTYGNTTSSQSASNNTVTGSGSTTGKGQTTSSTGSATGVTSSQGTTNTQAGDTTQKADPMTALAQAMGLTGGKVSYQTFSVGDRYPTGEYVICVPSDPGCRVLAVEFTIQNTSVAAVTVNSKNANLAMKLTANDSTVNQEATLLKNDITALNNVTIEAGQSYSAVAVFQVSEEVANNISKLSVGVYANGSSIGTVTLK